jgi:predicted DCC family thiol-disulfide oxidoreductase YuxK
MQSNDSRPGAWDAWVFYDGQCGFCSSWVEFWRPVLERKRITIAALQESWVIERLHLPSGSDLLADILLLSATGKLVSGADVYLQVTRRIWWAWPFYALFSLPGLNWLLHMGYRWFNRNRYRVSRACSLAHGPNNGSAGRSER